MEYNVEYRYDNDIKENFLQNKVALKFKKVEWKFDDNFYRLEYDEAKPYCGYFSDEYILVLFIEDSLVHPHPNNLLMYNLKKEIIKIIPPPTPINWDKVSPIHGIGEIKKIDGENYISVGISTDNYFLKEKGVIGFIEVRWLNLKTFEYHPTENTFIKDYGR